MKMFLSLEEKQFLYRKFRKTRSHNDSAKRVDEMNKMLHNMAIELNQEKKSPVYIQNQFNLEFEKLINE
jgi:hypothetical protein